MTREGGFCRTLALIWRAKADSGRLSVGAVVDAHPEWLEDMGEVAAIMAYAEQLAAGKGSLERVSCESLVGTRRVRDVIAMAVLAEYAIDDLLLLPYNIREAQLTQLAEDAGVGKEALRCFCVRWHGVYKKLLPQCDG